MQRDDQYWREIIDPGDRASELAAEVCRGSYDNCPAVTVVPRQPGNFRGAVTFVPKPHVLQMMADGTITMVVQNDGAGGKPQFMTLVGTPEAFATHPWEIITMNADDIARSGALPCVMANDLNAKGISDANWHLFEAMMKGLGGALRATRIVNITGETAIMKHSITAFCDTGSSAQLVMTWGGTCIGLAHRDLFIDGSKIRPGMPVVGFWEKGFRCNGGTLCTNLLLHHFGPSPGDVVTNLKALEFAQKLVVPSQCYAPTICRVIGWNSDGTVGQPLVRITGIAHITGGGVWGKFVELLPDGIGANLYAMPQPAQVLLDAQEMSQGTSFQLSDWRAYRTFHGGCGMLLVVEDADNAQRLIDAATADGIKASVVGQTTKSDDREVVIASAFREGKFLSSLHPE
ncbi:MAG: AIR synthase-related protein [Parcubacteria group bacterium]